jgi:hypothetical protein
LPTLPFRNEKFLCARLRTSLSKYTRNPCFRPCNLISTLRLLESHLPRMASFLSGGMPCQRGLLPSTMLRHSSLASRSETEAGKRCDKRVRIESEMGEEAESEGMRRMRRERMSPGGGVRVRLHEVRGRLPIEGPPKIASQDPYFEEEKGNVPITRIISLLEPPSSDTGRT